MVLLDEAQVESRFSPCGDNVNVTPQVFSSIIVLHLHKHKHASFMLFYVMQHM
jgi:hypothetical protein